MRRMLNDQNYLGSEKMRHAAATYLNVVLLFIHRKIGITGAKCGATSDADRASNGLNFGPVKRTLNLD